MLWSYFLFDGYLTKQGWMGDVGIPAREKAVSESTGRPGVRGGRPGMRPRASRSDRGPTHQLSAVAAAKVFREAVQAINRTDSNRLWLTDTLTIDDVTAFVHEKL